MYDNGSTFITGMSHVNTQFLGCFFYHDSQEDSSNSREDDVIMVLSDEDDQQVSSFADCLH